MPRGTMQNLHERSRRRVPHSSERGSLSARPPTERITAFGYCWRMRVTEARNLATFGPAAPPTCADISRHAEKRFVERRVDSSRGSHGTKYGRATWLGLPAHTR